MEEKILDTIRKAVNDIDNKLEEDESIFDQIDSITFVKMVVALETEFDFEFDDEMLSGSKFETMEELIDYVKQKIRNNG